MHAHFDKIEYVPVQLVYFADTRFAPASSVEASGTPPSSWVDSIPLGPGRQLQEMMFLYERNPLCDGILSLIGLP